MIITPVTKYPYKIPSPKTPFYAGYGFIFILSPFGPAFRHFKSAINHAERKRKAKERSRSRSASPDLGTPVGSGIMTGSVVKSATMKPSSRHGERFGCEN
jgi:hypothetical protein